MPRARVHGAVIFAAAALLLAGCRVDAAVDIRVDADGGGELVVIVGVDEELVTRASQAGIDPLAEVAAVAAGAGDWTVEQPDPGAGAGRTVRLRTGFADPEELTRLSRELAGGLAAAELAPPLDAFALEVEQRRVSLTGGAALAPTPVVAELGLTPDEAVELLRGAVDYRVTVTMPGGILSTSGDRLTPRSATWHVEAGESVDIAVVAERPWARWLHVASVVAVAAIGASFLSLAMRHRRRASSRGVRPSWLTKVP